MIDSLGDRIKGYEKAYNITLPKRLPIIIRVDGKNFHSLLRNIKSPFDEGIKNLMDSAACKLLNEIQGAVFAYVQSDEISVLIINYSSLEYSPWFANELQKIVSVSASLATMGFDEAAHFDMDGRFEYLGDAAFDARTFILPKEEVCNYFIWRQQNWTRNSVQMLARTLYSHNQLNDKNNEELQEMIFQKGLNWNDLETWKKRGRCFYKKDGKIHVDNDPPIFTQDREFIEKYVFIESENVEKGD
jgi:tRNA(His) guanylyltransferase